MAIAAGSDGWSATLVTSSMGIAYAAGERPAHASKNPSVAKIGAENRLYESTCVSYRRTVLVQTAERTAFACASGPRRYIRKRSWIPVNEGAAVGRTATGASSSLRTDAQGALGTAPALALARTETHARRYPHAQYEQERELLATEALLRLGRGADAELRAARFLARFPGSSYATRARQQSALARSAR